MKKLYTAVGQLHFRGSAMGNRCPILVVNGNETTPNMSEMILWCTLYWQILTDDELETQFAAKKKEVKYEDSMSASAVMYWMMRRGLTREGVGDTYEDALYDLLSRLYITPIEVNPLLDVVSFLRMVFSDGLPVKTALQVFNRDRRSDGEKKIMKLLHKVKLTTAETVRCFDRNVLDLQNEDEVVERLYQDDYTTSENIADEMRSSPVCRSVLTDISNLYLRKQIVFDRI